jgi:hypothetical protein
MIATFVQDDEYPAPLVDRGAAPLVVRQALQFLALWQESRPLPRGFTLDDIKNPSLPTWATGKKWVHRPIAGGSDAPEGGFNVSTVRSGPPCES